MGNCGLGGLGSALRADSVEDQVREERAGDESGDGGEGLLEHDNLLIVRKVILSYSALFLSRKTKPKPVIGV